MFTEKGKMWHGIGHVKLHLNNLLGGWWQKNGGIPEDWEIVTYDLVEAESQNAKEAYEGYRFEKKAKEEKQAKASHRAYLKKEVARLEELKRKLEEEEE